MSNGVHIMPISGINAYATKWTMKARVISKGSRTYKNAKGEGKLLNVEFADAHVRSRCLLVDYHFLLNCLKSSNFFRDRSRLPF
jgi:hypothetical protein